ncbi:cation diffusion facilitator family transporter [Solobacterium sp.]|uniref:cation diffusion facilitator family transporter n=1 Tax=Solobacterium sp. TaxID=2060878 RepID=UPI001CB335BD|nr:cation diffusion facilitator family transporter [Solobacterium sp.]MBF1100425.1 cation transporter [Solobacterium sp.]
MINYLIKKYIKNPEDIQNETVRFAYGKLTSIIGIIANLLLFIVKLTIGFMTGSVSIMSDGFNNLSDVMTCFVTVLGYRIASKPADREHPFGHGRVEYVVSFVIAVVIFTVSFELIKQGIQQIMEPNEILFRPILMLILVLSIGVKLWISYLNHTIGKKIDNLAMIATAQDARNDAWSTLITIVAMLLSQLKTTFPFDGVATLVIACFILKSGYELIKEIIDRLIGKPADKELVKQIRETILKYKEIRGLHDLIIHDYGPGVKIGSAHAEVDAKMNIVKIHDIIDQAEREVGDTLHVMMTLHMDPIEYDNPITNAYFEDLKRILSQIDPAITVHDFRTVRGDEHTNLVFDLVIPYGFHLEDEQIKVEIDHHFEKYPNKIYTVITFDHPYTGG